MKNILKWAGFFLVLTVVLSGSPHQTLAGGEVTPTPTAIPEVSNGIPVYGGAPIYGGQPVYGGGVISPRSGEVLVDKMVKNPATGIFVDHLGPTDPKYKPREIITFQIKVNNAGEETLNEVNVTDSLADYVDFMTGPGSFDADSGKLTFKVENLTGGDSRTYEIRGRISHQAVIPEEKNVICPVNVVEAETEGKSDRDESQFCIEKEMEVPVVPKAGPEHWVLSLIGIASALITGNYLKKKAYQI